MDARLATIVFIIRTALCRGCDVAQSPLILTALYNEMVSISCDITFQGVGGAQLVTSSIYRWGASSVLVDSLDFQRAENTSGGHVASHRFQVMETGFYRCLASCRGATNFRSVTYIHVRDSGYTEPFSPQEKLRCGLIVLCVLLVLMSSAATYLLLPLYWKRKEQSAAQTRGGAAAAPGATAKPQTARPQAEEASGSLYTSLQPRSSDVYDVLEEEPPGHSNRAHRAEIHHAAGEGPLKRPKPQKARKVTDENDVYENINR